MKILKHLSYILFTLASLQIFAQSSIKQIASTIEFDKAQRPCIQLNIEPQPKELKTAWSNYLKDNYDIKLKSKKSLLMAEKIVFNAISSNTLDFFTNITEVKNGSQMKVFVRHGYDIYINKENKPKEYLALSKLIENFTKEYIPIYYQDKISEAEKEVKKLVNKTEGLQKDITNDTEKISKLKNEIVELEDTIKSNKEELKEEGENLNTAKENLLKTQNKLKKI